MLNGFKTTKITTRDKVKIHLQYAGKGQPLLLLHGYPQTHLMWHKIAPKLSRDFMVVAADLRGHGDSSKPASDPAHLPYSKRAMAKDQVDVMTALGFDEFTVIGHDRGARVAHRLAQDYPEKIKRLILLDMLPTLTVLETINNDVANAYYHWFFLSQPDGLPEKLIGANPAYYLQEKLKRWSKIGLKAFPEEVLKEYLRCSTTPEAIHAACEDYRAAVSIDLVHDKTDKKQKLRCPLLVLWAKEGFIGKHYDVLKVWRQSAKSVTGRAINCGHFIAEEAPEETYGAIYQWLK